MPKIFVEMLPGRSVEQKREMVSRITDVMVETMNVGRDTVHIIIHENCRENVAQGGVLFCDRSKTK